MSELEDLNRVIVVGGQASYETPAVSEPEEKKHFVRMRKRHRDKRDAMNLRITDINAIIDKLTEIIDLINAQGGGGGGGGAGPQGGGGGGR